ncbi:MAG: tetratricopeptide repeat protein [Leucothrix sp.]
MFSSTSPNTVIQVPAHFLLSAEKQSPVFYRINVEYFLIYHGIKHAAAKQAIFDGLANNLVNTHADLRHRSTQWEAEHEKILETLALKVSSEVKRQQKQLPVAALQRLPPDIKSTQLLLAKAPNDHLCHFHLGWLYAIAKDHTLAERHFNVAALQSQSINPQLACFAYRHLANVRAKAGRHAQALLAIEAACELNQRFNPELQFERIRLLSRAQKTTQALAHLNTLVSKAQHYEIIALQNVELQKNPLLSRYFLQARDNHISNIKHQLLVHWKNDPLHLLDLDQELGQKNSVGILHNKQNEMLSRLSPLLIFDETISSKLIQQRSHSIILQALNQRKQHYIHRIEEHQARAGKIHHTGQWMLYATVISLIALAISYGVSTVAYQFDYHWPINVLVQSIVLSFACVLMLLGGLFLYFTPNKLPDLLKQKQRLEELSLRFSPST